MLRDPLFLLLRFLHITSGVFWAGSAFLIAAALVFGPAGSGEEGGSPLASAVLRRRMLNVLIASSIVAIGSGAGLFRKFYGHARWDWLHPHQNEVYAVGFFAALIAFLTMSTYCLPANRALWKTRAQMDDATGTVRETLRLAHGRLLRRTATAWRIIAAFLFVTVTTMAVGRYIF